MTLIADTSSVYNLGSQIDAILANYADAIEGGTVYRDAAGVDGPTAYKGIAGVRSNDPGIRSGEDATFEAISGSSTTSIKLTYSSGVSYAVNRWVKDDAPGFFAICTHVTTANVGAARRITNWTDNGSTIQAFTVDAFPSAVASGDNFTMAEGFKRLPNGLDIEDEGPEFKLGFDRFFQLSALPGSRAAWYGAGRNIYETDFEIRLRILKYGRHIDAIASAIENLLLIRSIITRGTLRDNNVLALIADEKSKPEVVKEDKDKVVVKDTLRLLYSVSVQYT